MQYIKDVLYSIHATNVVDIAIIAGLLYFILAWLRATRAFQIMATIIGIGLFYFVAAGLGLVLTSLLFQYLWAAIILVLVIVFQPEIRQMLDRASPLRFLLSGRHANDVASDLVEEVVKAVAELARLRIGALIVFRRLDRIDNVILKGKLLDSLMSSEALVMIFQKNSPLHDGAVLIFRDRITAAGCILPLSTDEDLSSQFGTRHRAALGLTERSDALCVVVSEERGEVSLVQGKDIKTYRKKADFRDALDRALVPGRALANQTQPGPLSLLRSNALLMILATAISVLLWVVIVGPQRAEVGMSVPIQYTNLPAGMEITGKWVDRVDVRVRGSERGVATLKPGSIRAVVDLSHVVTGLNFFRITSKNLLVPPGITIAQIRPSDLQLNIEAASAKKINVVPTIVGVLPESTKLSVTPSEVRVRASRQELRKVKSATTDPVKATDLLARGHVVAPVQIKPDGVAIDSVEPAQVTVSVETSKQ
jgi:diadenylate cyclase